MPGTPNSENSKLNTLQNEEQKEVQQENNQNEPVVREVTLTDVLNKRLLVTFLERINKSEEYSCSEETQTEIKNKDQVDSDF